LSTHVVNTDWSAHFGLYRFSVWSTRVDLVVTDPGVIVAAVALLNRTLDRVDIVASRLRHDSEINALHRSVATGDAVPVSVDLLEAVEIAIRAARLTDGAVDPTVGTAMCQLAIASRLGCGVLVSLGGDIAVGGVAPEGGFSVGIADICGDPSAPVAVSILSGGLATSGIANRHSTFGGHPVHHLIGPATGLSADSPWRTVSVAAGSCVDANTASTAAMVMGEMVVPWLEQERLPARLVRLDGSTLTVAGWPPQPSATAPVSTGSSSRTSVPP
jgi:thiamine biosynthesis lipoprotein